MFMNQNSFCVKFTRNHGERLYQKNTFHCFYYKYWSLIIIYEIVPRRIGFMNIKYYVICHHCMILTKCCESWVNALNSFNSLRNDNSLWTIISFYFACRFLIWTWEELMMIFKILFCLVNLKVQLEKAVKIPLRQF